MNRPTTQLANSLDIDLVRAALEVDYVVLEELGRGGMAVVYRAKEKALDREVAIKVLPSYMAIDEAFVERFQHEARTAGKLEHPNIVPIYRVGNAGRVIFFVMKMLKGQSLSTVLRSRPKLGVPEIRRILMETALALGYAAKHGVVHRDIKPDNILLDDEGRCVITDFGIAKSSGGPNTAAGTSMGTPRYMSPEHARGHKLDGRSDMYSLGVVAYQCLVGRTPFDAEDPFAILYQHINEPLPKPSLGNHEEQVLYAIIEQMLAKNPEDRFQTADDLIVALGGQASSTTRTLVTGGRISAMGMKRPSGLSATEIILTPTFVGRIREFTTRITKERPAVASSVGVAAVALLAWAVWPRDRAPEQTPAATPAAQAPGRADSATRGGSVVAVGASTGALGPIGASASPLPGATTALVAAGATTGAKVAAKPDSTATKAAAPVTKAPVRTAPAIPRRDLASKCPASTKAGDVGVLVDSVGPQREGGKLTVNYDVCGLSANTPFTTKMTLTKLRQRSIRRQGPVWRQFIEAASSLRSRRRQVLNLAELDVSAGSYALEVLITDPKGQEKAGRREFQIVER